jgi:hypothetical protein
MSLHESKQLGQSGSRNTAKFVVGNQTKHPSWFLHRTVRHRPPSACPQRAKKELQDTNRALNKQTGTVGKQGRRGADSARKEERRKPIAKGVFGSLGQPRYSHLVAWGNPDILISTKLNQLFVVC